MSEQNSPGQELQAAPAYIDRIGPALIAARENLGLSVEDVANRLRLSLRQVQALEGDDFAVLPEAVITRGFIRNYARLVNVDATPLLQVYSQYVPVQDTQAISIPSANIVISGEAGMSWRPYVWFGVALVILLCGWVVYVDFFQKHDTAAVPVASDMSGSVDLPSVEGVLDGAGVSAPVVPSVSESSVSAQPIEPAQDAKPSAEPIVPPALPTPAAAALPPVESSATQAAANNGGRLKFSASEATWVSVFDGSGKQIFNKTLAANSEELVAGQPPFRVVVGNTTGTRVEYNNNPVDLAPYTKVNVARLRLE